MTNSSRIARTYDGPATLEPRQLFRFLLISMLLHSLLLLVFGTSTGGRSAQHGDDEWGGLDVTLRRLSPEPGGGIKLAPGEETASPGTSILRRLGAARAAPAAAEESSPAPAPMEPAMPPPHPTMPSVAPGEPPVPLGATGPQEAAPAAPASSFEALPPVNRSAPEVVDRTYAPAAPPPAAKVDASPPPAAKVDLPPSPPVEPTPREIPATPAPPVAPPALERPVVPSIEAPMREVPTPPALPAPEAIERTAPPKIEPVPAVERTAPPKVEPAPSIERTAPPKIEPAPAIEAPPREIPALPAPQPLAPVAPPKIERETAPALEAPRERPASAPPAVERAAPPSERALPSSVVPGKTQAAPAPSRTDVPGEPAPRLRLGAPEPGDEIFRPRGDAAPASDAGAAPRLDLEATRQRAREIASDGSAYRGFVPAIPPPPALDRKSKLADAIDKAQKPDCRDAYAAMGLLAVPALVVSTVGNGGCRW